MKGLGGFEVIPAGRAPPQPIQKLDDPAKTARGRPSGQCRRRAKAAGALIWKDAAEVKILNYVIYQVKK